MGRCAAWVILFAALAASCSSRGGTAASDAGEAGAATGWACQQIRMCVFECGDDTCVQTCEGRGAPAAQTTFEALRACTAKTCATGDINCACGEQCMADGTCLHETDACVGMTRIDDICDSLCA